jgi:hypothetical protein
MQEDLRIFTDAASIMGAGEQQVTSLKEMRVCYCAAASFGDHESMVPVI